MRVPSSRAWWEEETRFIEEEAKKPYPMGEFRSYRVMQAKFAEKDGFVDLAARILSGMEDKP